MQKYVLGFLFSEDKKHVVLINKTKPKWQAGKLNGVGGKMEIGEEPIDSMIREFEEETGYHHEEWRLFATTTNSQFIVYCFVAFKSGIQIKTMTEEIVMKVKVSDILTDEYQIIPNCKWMVSLALDTGFEPVTIVYHEEDKYNEPVK